MNDFKATEDIELSPPDRDGDVEIWVRDYDGVTTSHYVAFVALADWVDEVRRCMKEGK